MKQFKSEHSQSYENYSFSYCQYALKESGDKLSDIYKLGFLPYSGSPDIKDTLYMCRGARVRLGKWRANSENRRIMKRFDGLFEMTSIPINKFAIKDEAFLKFCTNYFLKRHGEKIMPKDRLLTILSAGFITDIIEYKKNNELVAYALEAGDNNISHFWFSFYDLEYAFQSLGMWLMIDSVRRARKENKKHSYLGTVYGEKALYKTNFNNLEFWNGNEWSEDIKTLKKMARNDINKESHILDRWKENRKIF